MKFTIIGLTIVSLLLAPQVLILGVNPTSEDLSSFKTSVNENFDALTNSVPDFSRDYDFQQFSPNISEIINSFVQFYSDTLKTADEFINLVSNFFSNPGVVIFGEDEFSDDPITLGYIPNGRFTQILWESTFRSNESVALDVLSSEELTFVASRPLFTQYPTVQAFFFLYRNILIDKSIHQYAFDNY
jgi:hypothetical protein